MNDGLLRGMIFDYIKKFFPVEIKNWIKSHHLSANLIDRFFHDREIGIYNGIQTLLSPNEMQFLYGLAKTVQNGIIVEIGCYDGGSAYFFGKGCG